MRHALRIASLASLSVLSAYTVFGDTTGSPPATPVPKSATSGPATSRSSAPETPAPETAASGSSAPTSQPTVESLVDGLSSTRWHDRDKAEAALILRGEEAVPALEGVIKTATLDEARTAATRALKQILENRRIGASLVTLHLKDVPIAKLFEELSRQSFAPLKPFPDGLWAEQFADRKVSIDVDRLPFWAVMQQLSKDVGVELGSVNGEPRLVASEGQLSGRRFNVSGPFLVIATQMHRSQSVDLQQADSPTDDDFAIHFSVLAEPKLKILAASSVAKLEQVVDDHGNSLLPEKQPAFEPDEDSISPNFGTETAYPLSAWMKYPAKNPGRRISRLKGSATFTVQVESEKMDVPLKSLRGTTRTFKGIPLTFGELQKTGDNWQLKITTGANDQHAAWEELQNSIMGQLRAVDARGQALDHHGFGSGGGAGAIEISVSFGASHRPEDGRQSGEPTRLVWEIPTRTRLLSVPFEFKDLKMP